MCRFTARAQWALSLLFDMPDTYPPNLEIEIDRPRLTTYLRVQWLLGWICICFMFGFMFAIMAASIAAEHVESPWVLKAIAGAAAFFICLAACLLLAGLLYFLFSHCLAARFAQELRVTVEGPFLRIHQYLIATTDHKLHFRAIVDYAAIQDPLMRLFGLHALQMTTTGSGPSGMIKVPGVKECLKIRDMLSEIDRLRENEP
jgi:hypothetical protein